VTGWQVAAAWALVLVAALALWSVLALAAYGVYLLVT
jgi:hypothetical protein